MAIDGHAGLMAHVYQRDSLEEIEDKKAERCENHRALDRAHLFRGFGAEVEERGTDSDSGAESSDRADASAGAQRDEPSKQRGHERGRGDGEDAPAPPARPSAQT